MIDHSVMEGALGFEAKDWQIQSLLRLTATPHA
ncbi:hypothetical protein [Xanthomonas phage JGB6]|nr:hypothetical protein [Xanthomonas phage JGB6]